MGPWRFTTSCGRPIPGQDHRHRRTRLAERRPQLRAAMPGPITQAVVLRDFVARANALGIDYNIVEAIDQPEKLFEGNVGPYWGILDASLRPKFAWTGPLVDPDYWKAAVRPSSLDCCCRSPFCCSRGDHRTGSIARRRRPCDRRLVRQRAWSTGTPIISCMAR